MLIVDRFTRYAAQDYPTCNKIGQCKTLTADCRLRTRGKNADCRLRVKCRLGAKCRIKTVDFFKHLCSFFSKSVKQLAGISYTLRFLVVVHRTFNENPNSLSLRTLICNTFIEGHPNFLQNIFLCCWNDLLPFYRHNSSCTVFWVSSFHLSVNIVVLHQFTVPGHVLSKTSHLKLERQVSRTEKKVQDCYYVFGSSMTFQRRKEWICKSRCRQVSVYLHVFGGFFYP